MEQKAGEGGKRTVIKNVFVGRNETTGRPYFQRKRVRVLTPETALPPTMDELPPLDQNGNPILQKSLDEEFAPKKRKS